MAIKARFYLVVPFSLVRFFWASKRNERTRPFRAYPKTCFACRSVSERIIGKAREAGVSSGYVDAAERSIGFAQPREAQMRFSDRLLM